MYNFISSSYSEDNLELGDPGLPKDQLQPAFLCFLTFFDFLFTEEDVD